MVEKPLGVSLSKTVLGVSSSPPMCTLSQEELEHVDHLWTGMRDPSAESICGRGLEGPQASGLSDTRRKRATCDFEMKSPMSHQPHTVLTGASLALWQVSS